MEDLETPVKYLGKGGRAPQKVRSFIPGSGSIIFVVWRRYVGGNPVNWTSTGEFPP